LIEVIAHASDRRSRLVALTPMGRKKLAQSLPLWEDAQRRFESAFGGEKAKKLRATLDYIASAEFARLTLEDG
jgi:DNA-binding MarR family transcriptional regulator